MKRDKQLLKYLLLQLREGKAPLELKSYSEKTIIYHCALLIDGGYVDGEVIRDEEGNYAYARMQHIISKGHDFLEQMEKVDAPNMKVPTEIIESLEQFRRDHPDAKKAAFLMMRFGETDAHKQIVNSIRAGIGYYNIKALRADDKDYHDDLFSNILTYMHGCGFGIAIFERLEEESFNPNVSLEVGYMLALGKPVLLLKDQTLKTLHTDLIGKLYKTFDPQNPSKTIPQKVTKWLRDKQIVSPKPLSSAQKLRLSQLYNKGVLKNG